MLAATMSLIDKVGAVWRSLFGADKHPALAEAVENVGRRAPKPAAAALAAESDSKVRYIGFVTFVEGMKGQRRFHDEGLSWPI